MSRQMIFKTIAYDTQYPNKDNILNFFVESTQNDESITLMNEERCVKWLFDNPTFLHFFAEAFFEKTDKIKSFLNLKDPFVTKNKKPGDIDLILIDTDFPDKCIAFECKRIKALSLIESHPKVNGVEKIKGGITQVKFYKELGFYQCYLLIIVLDDARFNENTNTVLKSTDNQYLRDLYNIPRRELTDEEIGIVFIKIHQITGKHIDSAGRFGFCIDREAKSFEQAELITKKIKGLIE